MLLVTDLSSRPLEMNYCHYFVGQSGRVLIVRHLYTFYRPQNGLYYKCHHIQSNRSHEGSERVMRG